MNTDKKLENFLPDKNAVYFRSFDQVTEEQKVSEKDIINKINVLYCRIGIAPLCCR